MIAIKTGIKHLPESCDLCQWYGLRTHPIKGWIDICELCRELMGDDSKEGWHYNGENRPENCPLIEVSDVAQP